MNRGSSWSRHIWPMIGTLVLGLICIALTARMMHAQASGSMIPAPIITPTWQTVPGAIPTTATDLCAQTFYVTDIAITNTNASATVTVTITSKTGVVLFVGAIPGQTGSNNYEISYPRGIQYPGGVTWIASGAGVNGQIKGGF